MPMDIDLKRSTAHELSLWDDVVTAGEIQYVPRSGRALRLQDWQLLTIASEGEMYHRYNGEEPRWIHTLSSEMQLFLRAGHQSEISEPLVEEPELPYAGFGYIVEEGGLVEDTVRGFNLWRLNHVAQLGLLQVPTIGPKGESIAGRIYTHNRYTHSLDVYALINLMAIRCDLSDHERTHLIVAALTHDALTPAGGDSIKRINSTLFDEDAHYSSMFKREFWPELRNKYQLDETLLSSIIMGQGKLGRFLDLADKLAYTARDVNAFISSLPRQTPDGMSTEQALIRDTVAQDPLICGLWDSIKVVNDQVVVTDLDRLARFLKLRALMFKALYYNPSARVHEDVTVGLIAGYLFEKGDLTKSRLLVTVDSELHERLEKFLGVPSLFLTGYALQPTVKTFSNTDLALEEERQLVRKRGLMTHLMTSKPLTTSGTRSFKVLHKGEVTTFGEARSEDMAEIEKIMPKQEEWLYSFSTTGVYLPQQLLRRLRKARRQRLQV